MSSIYHHPLPKPFDGGLVSIKFGKGSSNQNIKNIKRLICYIQQHRLYSEEQP